MQKQCQQTLSGSATVPLYGPTQMAAVDWHHYQSELLCLHVEMTLKSQLSGTVCPSLSQKRQIQLHITTKFEKSNSQKYRKLIV